MVELINLVDIAARLHDPDTGRILQVEDLQAWRRGVLTTAPFPEHGYETRDDQSPLWDWWTTIVPWLVATGRAGMLAPYAGLLRVYETPTGTLALSPSGAQTPDVFEGVDLPTLTVGRMAVLAVEGKRYSARQRRRCREQQRAAGMHRPMSAAYAAAVVAERKAAREQEGRIHVVEVEPDHIQIIVGTQEIGDWYRESVPAMGRMWCWHPIGHALPTAYSSTRPQGWPYMKGVEAS